MRQVLFILGNLSDNDIDWMMSVGKRLDISQGAVLIREGASIQALYIVLQGLLSVSVQALADKEIARLVCGDIAGEMSFIDARPPSATVQALEDSTVWAVPRTPLLNKLEQEPGFAARFYRAMAVFLSQRLRDMDQRLGQYEDPRWTERRQEMAELDPTVLDTLYLAGSRFDRMLGQLLGQ